LVIILPTGPVNGRCDRRWSSVPAAFERLSKAGSGAGGAAIQIRFIAMLKPPFKFLPDIHRARPGGRA